MKYIRTKDEIMTYENWERTNVAIEEHNNKPSRYIKLSMRKLDIIKQADTIEELCDEFIYKHLVFTEYKDVLKIAHDKQFIYGAIWTDKGLIYVAKMNDKGELELL